jgi:dTMP kinase
MFIALEGVNASGKGTQAQMLLDFYCAHNIPAIMVNELSSTNLGLQIRQVVKYDTTVHPIDPHADVGLYMTARLQLYYTVIKPALAEGKVVIADRWITSTLVYGSFIRVHAPVPQDIIKVENCLLPRSPDLTILLRVTAEEAYKRRTAMRGDSPDRFEQQGLTLLERLVLAYDHIFSFCSDHEVVNGMMEKERVHQRILLAVTRLQARLATREAQLKWLDQIKALPENIV